MFGASRVVAARSSLAFVAPIAIEAGLPARIEAERQFVPTKPVRSLTKGDMPLNDALPR